MNWIRKRNRGRLAAWLILPALAGSLALPTARAADDTPNMRLHGALVVEPCVIPPGEETIQLDFGAVEAKFLYLHTRTVGQAFNIHLTDCDPTIAKTVQVTFTGTESAALPGLLALDTASTATGIAIGLETPAAKSVPLNTATDKAELHKGDNEIALQAYVQGEPTAITDQGITEGAFSAVATFALTYE
ncbi:fimbrial protein [Serratia marcescens]|uniref:fimbrial protein n=1 Tax=Serratia marcescens TaxID=615 RepID=UPI0007C96504|nr:fimbrial protein [Serratia marcescens]OAH32766.1 exotoxin [Serratia marcescens]